MLGCQRNKQNYNQWSNITIAVSYTHLDVYKRQEEIRRFQTAKCDRRITDNQIEELITIYKWYRHVFSDTPGKIKNFQCEIKFKETADFKKKSYPIAYSQKEAVRTEINRLIEEDIIEV